MLLGGPLFFLQMTGSMTEVFGHADILARCILVIVSFISITSWAIMISKVRLFRSARGQTKKFMNGYWEQKSLKELVEAGKKTPKAPEARLVKAVSEEFEKGQVVNPDALDKVIDGAIVSIMSGWEKNVIFLATAASACPLMGLFGTIWGIMVSFMSMGVQGSASLLVVGPGIAISLIVTFFGLGAAIPALIGYNYTQRFIHTKWDELATFAGNFRNRIMEKAYVEFEGAGDVFAQTSKK
jgi:biopolymer transport protein TolQ